MCIIRCVLVVCWEEKKKEMQINIIIVGVGYDLEVQGWLESARMWRQSNLLHPPSLSYYADSRGWALQAGPWQGCEGLVLGCEGMCRDAKG